MDSVKTQYLRVNKKARIDQEPKTQAERHQYEGKVASIVMKQDIHKWLPIVKKNRKSERIDFIQYRNIQISKIQNQQIISDQLSQIKCSIKQSLRCQITECYGGS